MDFYLDDEARMKWDAMISGTQLAGGLLAGGRCSNPNLTGSAPCCCASLGLSRALPQQQSWRQPLRPAAAALHCV